MKGIGQKDESYSNYQDLDGTEASPHAQAKQPKFTSPWPQLDQASYAQMRSAQAENEQQYRD
jgi:hypothetical protein